MEDNKIITVEEIENLFATGKINKLWGFVLDDTEGYEIEDFVKYCIKNIFDGKDFIFHYHERTVIYYYLEEPNSVIVQKVQNDVSDFFKRIREIKKSGFDDILEKYEEWYKKNIGIIPRIRDFFLYLVNSEYTVFNDEYLKIYLANYIFYEESTIIESYQNAKDKQQVSINSTPHQTLPIEPKQKSISEKSIYDLPDDFEVSDFAQWDNDAQFSVPRILDEGEVCFWVYNNIAEVKGIFYESFICETDDDDGEEEEGYMFNRTGEGVRKWYDGGESIFKSWLRISDDKYFNFILDPIYNSFHDIHETGLERTIRKNLSYDWNYGKFALDILFCDFIEPEVKGKDTYYKIVPKYSGVPDLQFFVEEELKLIAYVNSYIPLDTIPYFFKYHFEKSKNAIEFLRNAIKTTNNAWGMTPLSILCKNTFKEWLDDTIQEYKLDREEIFRQSTTFANVEEGKIILTKTGEQFTLPQIALIYYYDKLLLNGNNCNDIVLTYGWNSGKKLLEWHTKFSTGTSHRLYAPSSGKRIYSVLEYLTTEKGKTDAKKDLKDIGFDFE